MEQLADEAVLPGLLLAHLEDLWGELALCEDASPASCLSNALWARQVASTTSLLSHPPVWVAAKALVSSPGGVLSIPDPASGGMVALLVPPAPALHNLAVCVLRALAAASPTDSSDEQLAYDLDAAYDALRFPLLCTQAALDQQGSGELAVEQGEETLTRALDALPVATTWLNRLRLDSTSAGALRSLQASSVEKGTKWIASLASEAGEAGMPRAGLLCSAALQQGRSRWTSAWL